MREKGIKRKGEGKWISRKEEKTTRKERERERRERKVRRDRIQG